VPRASSPCILLITAKMAVPPQDGFTRVPSTIFHDSQTFSTPEGSPTLIKNLANA
jgi:hypothetical protein